MAFAKFKHNDAPSMEKHIDVKFESGKKFFLEFQNKGKVVMLNLLKFKEEADYANFESLNPESKISGKEAYKLYMKNVSPLLDEAGSRLIYYGECNSFLIGPESEHWDAILLVEHESVKKFMEFAQNENYLKYIGHRTAALEDSRLLPSSELV